MNSMISNLVRSAALVLALVVAWLKLDLKWLAVAGLVGEVLAYLTATGRLWAVHGVPAYLSWKPVAVAGLAMAAAWMLAGLLPSRSAGVWPVVLGGGLAVVYAVGVTLAFAASRERVRGLVSRWRHRGEGRLAMAPAERAL